MNITLHYLTGETGDTPTSDANAATRVLIRASGLVVMSLVRTTHPIYGVEGYSIAPRRTDANQRVRGYYEPERFHAGYLEERYQAAMWVDPAAAQPVESTRDPGEWHTLADLVAKLRPLLKR